MASEGSHSTQVPQKYKRCGEERQSDRHSHCLLLRFSSPQKKNRLHRGHPQRIEGRNDVEPTASCQGPHARGHSNHLSLRFHGKDISLDHFLLYGGASPDFSRSRTGFLFTGPLFLVTTTGFSWGQTGFSVRTRLDFL